MKEVRSILNRGKNGFTLLEVTVSILLMGLAVGSLVNMMDWSNRRCRELTGAWKKREALGSIHRLLRDSISCGKTALPSVGALEKEISRFGKFRIANLSVQDYTNTAMIVRISIFDDKNSNALRDSSESSETMAFCFYSRINR